MPVIKTSANLGILGEDCPVQITYSSDHYEVLAYHGDKVVDITVLVPFEWVDSEIKAKVDG